MSSIAKSVNLKEITIENNPISLAGDCVSFLVSYLPMLVSLNQLQITEQVRRAANAWRKSKENTDQNYQHLSSDVSSSIRREEIISNARTNWELIRSQQANIINGSQRQANQIKKSIKSKLIANNSSSSTSTTSSNANTDSSGSNGTNRKVALSRNLMDALPKRQKSKLLRSISHENTCSIISDSDCHLPPMMDQFGEKSLPKKRSASSTRNNVDSESDFVGSDEEELKSSSRVPTTPPIHPTSSQPLSPVEIVIKDNEEGMREESQKESQTPPLPPIDLTPVALAAASATLVPETPSPIDDLKDLQNNESLTRTPTPSKSPLTVIENSSGISIQATVNIESEPPARMKTAPQIELKMETTESDKHSTISKTSTVKTETNVTSPTSEDQRLAPSTSSHTANAHARNKSGVARKAGPPLIRSQTARNLSSHLNNQAAAGIAANQQNGGNAASGNNAAASKKEPKKEIDKDREQGE